jgi:hypothetical protein
MTAFRFIFPDDDDEGFELVEEGEEVSPNEDDCEEITQIDSDDDDIIWETEED